MQCNIFYIISGARQGGNLFPSAESKKVSRLDDIFLHADLDAELTARRNEPTTYSFRSDDNRLDYMYYGVYYQGRWYGLPTGKVFQCELGKLDIPNKRTEQCTPDCIISDGNTGRLIQARSQALNPALSNPPGAN